MLPKLDEQKPHMTDNSIANNMMNPGSALGMAPSAISGSIYERLGGDDGIKTFVDKLFAKIDGDPVLNPMFYKEGIDRNLLRDKFLYFFSHIMGGAQNWIGRPLDKVHRHMGIQDDHFDLFNSHCMAAVREMRRLKVDGMKEMLRIL